MSKKSHIKFLNVFLFIFVSTIVISQKSEEEKSIQKQFEDLFKISSSYQKYKVINKKAYYKLQSNVLDSLNNLRRTVIAQQKNITDSKNKSALLKKQIVEINHKLEYSLKQKNEISFLGVSVTKVSYNSIVWSIITILFSFLIFFIFRFKNSISTTRQTKIAFEEIEKEFNFHKKKSLEKEQKLRRKLQDEINKQRGV